MEIVESELLEQIKESIIKIGSYVKIEILVGNEKIPYINFKCINSNREKVAESIFCLKRLENYLYKQDPSLIKDVKDFKVIYEKGVKSDEKE